MAPDGLAVPLAEIIGALILIALVWILGTFLFRKIWKRSSPAHLQFKEESHQHHGGSGDEDKWTRVANAFVMDWSMLGKNGIGF